VTAGLRERMAAAVILDERRPDDAARLRAEAAVLRSHLADLTAPSRSDR
jgi:hypothetical protein